MSGRACDATGRRSGRQSCLLRAEEERLSFSAAREVVRVARPETAQEWIEKASQLSLEELAAEVQGVSPLYTRRFQLTPEQLGLLDDLLTVARKALGTGATNGELLAEICRRAACGAEGRGPVVRTSFVRCPDCDATHRQTSAGAVPVEPAVADAALCEGEVLDLQTGKVSRRIPSPSRRTIEGQHGGRCAVPGCRSRVLEAHHEDGWVHGHDPSRCLPLCRAHHKQRHQGWLRLETVDGEWRFYLEDGTFLGRAGADHKATDRLSRAPAVPVDRPLGSTPTPRAFAAAKAQAEQVMVGQPVLPPVASVGDLVRDAVSALRGLELRKREAEGLVRFALAAEPKREWRLEDLVGEALRAMPTAHLTG